MRRGFTLLEVLLAAVILGLGLAGILVSMSQSQKMMVYSTYYETAQEVMDLGEMAYPLAEAKDTDELEVRETKATELWDMISDERLSTAQEEKFHGYTWERECLNLHDSDEDINRIGGLYIVRVTVRWGDRFRGHGERESYVTFWRKEEQ
jgi:prepilin-type N-terminal cleavage/methylation domain-containing protein